MAPHHQLLVQLAVSSLLIAGTTFLHALFVAIGAACLRGVAKPLWGPARIVRDGLVISLLGLFLMLAHIIEIGMWAYAFLRLDLFASWEQAAYFSAVSYTTLGFGDVLLPERWGLLAGAAAANGLLLFGLSAAFLIETSARLRLGGAR
jgi:hypothetical protein